MGMNSQVGFIVKVFAFSTLLSFLIKYGGRLLPIAPTDFNASLAISIAPMIMALLLWWRFQNHQSLE